MTVTVEGLQGGKLPSFITFSDGTITFAPKTLEQVKMYQLQVKLTDGKDGLCIEYFNVEVTNPNGAAAATSEE